jgi:hypothetical protein
MCAWLAVAIWIAMIVAMVAGHIRYQPALDSFLYDVLMVEIALIVLIAVSFTWGLLPGANAGWHRRLMTLATLLLAQAGLGRMRWQPIPGPMLIWALLVPFFVFDIVTTRRVHPATLIGAGLVVASHRTILMNSGSLAWHEAADRAFSHLP